MFISKVKRVKVTISMPNDKVKIVNIDEAQFTIDPSGVLFIDNIIYPQKMIISAGRWVVEYIYEDLPSEIDVSIIV